jgi:hypothetical protein
LISPEGLGASVRIDGQPTEDPTDSNPGDAVRSTSEMFGTVRELLARSLSILLAGFIALNAWGSEKRLTDAQIRKLMIDESIAEYPGNCPCPLQQGPQWFSLRANRRF